MRRYTIQKGDTLNKVAFRFNSTVNEIFNASAFRSGDPDLVYPGEVAIIPDVASGPVYQPPEFGLDDGTVHIRFAGERLSGWAGVNIRASKNELCRGFSIDAPFDVENQSLVALGKPFSFPDVSVFIGNEQLLSGLVENHSYDLSGGDSTLSLEGRSLSSQLLVCSVPSRLQNQSGQTLGGMIRAFADMFSIPVKIEDDTGPLGDAVAEPGDTIEKFLREKADAAGLVMLDDARGRLVLRKQAQDKGAPVASFIEGDTIFAGFKADYKGSERYSSYTVYSQENRAPGSARVATDPTVERPRPVATVDKEGEKPPEWERAKAFFKSLSFSTSVPGWRTPDGDLWAPGMLVNTEIPSVRIDREINLEVQAVNFRLGSGEQSTDLELQIPGALSQTLPEETPWR